MTANDSRFRHGRWPAVVAVGLLLGLTACASPPQAKNGTNYQACHDGTCQVEVKPDTTIPVDEKFGLPPVRISKIDADQVSMRADSETRSKDGGYSSSHLSVTVTQDATGVLNGLEILVVSIDDGTAILEFSPPDT